MKLGDLAEAEDALSEANILNNKDAEVWSYLSLVCLEVSVNYQVARAVRPLREQARKAGGRKGVVKEGWVLIQPAD